MKTQEQVEFEEESRQNRLQEQEAEKDYYYEEDGGIEKCGDCRAAINSHGHCPNCDY